MTITRPLSAVRDGWTTAGAYSGSQEVADFLDVTVSTIQRWARTGELPAAKFGGRVLRFRKLDIEKWASRQPKASA